MRNSTAVCLVSGICFLGVGAVVFDWFGMFTPAPAEWTDVPVLEEVSTLVELDGAEFEGDVERGIFTLTFNLTARGKPVFIHDKVSLEPEKDTGFLVVVHNEFGPMLPDHTLGWLGFIQESSLEAAGGVFVIEPHQTAEFTLHVELRDELGMRSVEFRSLVFRTGSFESKARSVSLDEGTLMTSQVLLDNDHLIGVPQVQGGKLIMDVRPISPPSRFFR